MTPKPEPLLPLNLHGWFSWQEPMTQVLQAVRPQRCVEIGVWLGCSAVCTAEVIQAWGGTLECIDPWAPGWYDEATVTLFQPTAYEQFCSNVWHRGLASVITPLRTTGVLAAVDHGPVDFVYVDGDHEDPAPLNDLRAWWPLLTPGGAICGDDYGMPGVQHGWNTLAAETGVPLHQVEQFVWLEKPR